MKKMRRLILSMSILLIGNAVFGQEHVVISGSVTDNQGNSMPGTNVYIVNTTIGSLTDADGKYSFEAPINLKGSMVEITAHFLGFSSISKNVELNELAVTVDFVLVENALSLDPVAITAEMRDEDLQRVPISISAVESQTIVNLGANRMTDIELATPNLTYAVKARNTLIRVSIRGISGFSRNIGMESRTSAYLDGFYLGRSNAFNQNLIDIETVEVLRGPQGTLFGKNTTSGAINITTKKPSANLEVGAVVDYGRFNYLNANLMLNVPIIKNKLFAKFIMQSLTRDGFITNLYNDKKYNGLNTLNGRFQLRYISNNLEVMLGLNGNRDKVDHSIADMAIAGDGFELAPDVREVDHDSDEREDRNLAGGDLTINLHSASGYTFTSLTAYKYAKSDEITEEDYTPLFIAYSDFNETDRMFTQELRIVSPSDKRFNFVGGIYFLNQDSENDRGAFTGEMFGDIIGVPGLPKLTVKTPGFVKTNSIAGYFDGNYRIVPKLNLNIGLRYTYEMKDIEYQIKNDPFPVLFPDLDTTDSFNQSVLTPKFGLSYQAMDNLMVYGSVTRGFTSGGWNADFISTLDQFSFKPEFVWNYELGVKYNTLNNRLRINVAGFIAKFTDYQVFQFQQTEQGQAFITVTNAGKVTSKGLEFELSAVLFPGFTLTGGLGLVDAKYDEFKDAGFNEQGDLIDFDGNRLEFAPKTELMGMIDYKKRIGKLLNILAHFDISSKSDFYTNPDNVEAFLIKGYTLLNARIGLESDQGWGIYFWGKNLTDQLYMSSKDISFLGISRAYYELPATYGVRLTYTFSKR